MGNVATPWTDRNVIPYYKGDMGKSALRCVGSMDDCQKALSFKDRRYGT